MAFLASDNTSGVHANVLKAMADVSTGHMPSYGNDPVTTALNEKLRDLFKAPQLQAFPVFNGSASNGLALACMMRPFEAVIAHARAHIDNDECGLPEFFTGGKILTFEAPLGKLTPDLIEAVLPTKIAHAPHTSRPKVISLTQTTELGTVYTIAELKALSAVAKTHGLYLHMDGARFAGAVASLGCAPAAITSEVGIDILSFGGTKNGAMLAEAVVIFNPDLIKDFGYIHKRTGQLASKARFISAQFLGLLEGDLWLDLARHANAMAQKLLAGLIVLKGVTALYPVEANMLFVRMPPAMANALWALDHSFYQLDIRENVYRLVTSFATTDDEIDGFVSDCRRLNATNVS